MDYQHRRGAAATEYLLISDFMPFATTWFNVIACIIKLN
jgi:hypothetical protein